jgi:cytochrome P450
MADENIAPEAGASLRDRIMQAGRDAFIARLHAEAPLYKDASGFWIASRFEDVREILLDHARFSSAASGRFGASGPMGPGFPLLTDDPPRHSVLRRLLAKAFTPAAMETMRPEVERLARDLAAAIPEGAEVDIVEAMTTPLPVAVIAGMMGVPDDRAADFKRWSMATLGLQDGAGSADRLEMLTALRAYFSDLAAQRRRSPAGDLISAMTKVSDTSETLSDDQVVGFCILLMIAGNETTTNLLGNLLDRLADAPQDWAAMRQNPALIDAAIEESLRVDSPLQMIMRRTTQAVTLGGQTLAADEKVLVYLGSANHDPLRWADPANFDLARERDRHIAFGHGVHACIGAPLARIEAKAAMTALVERFETLARGSEQGQRFPGGILFGYRSLPVVFRS